MEQERVVKIDEMEKAAGECLEAGVKVNPPKEEKKKIDYKLKNRTRISNAVNKELWEDFKEYSKTSGKPLSKMLDAAIEMYLKSNR